MQYVDFVSPENDALIVGITEIHMASSWNVL